MNQPGDRFFIDPNALPGVVSGSVRNFPELVDRPAGVLPQVPDGFRVDVFAEGLGRARQIEVAPNGDVLVTRGGANDIVLLRDSNGDGVADLRSTLATGFDRPHAMEVRPDGLYVVDVGHVWRVPYTPGDLTASGPAQALTPAGALGPDSGHVMRSLAFSADGRSFFVGIGSESNLAVEPLPRATILQFDADGSDPRVYASGVRNPAALEIEPSTGRLVATVVERDAMGDELVPDFLTRIEPGGFYGWPYAYIGPNDQPNFQDNEALRAQTLVPDVLFQSHATPIGFTFYTGNQFPAEYAGDAFVALRGSWNAETPRGFMIAHVDVQNGVPQNGYEAFATGFVLNDGDPVEVYGRPTAVATGGDGSLLIGDDTGGTIYAVRWAPQGDAGPNLLIGGGGADVLLGAGGADTLMGGIGPDRLYGNQGNDLIFGERGNDTLFGGQGADTLHGGQGDDVLYGGMGNDWLFGGRGNDELTGGPGADIFAARLGMGADTVTDFNAREGDRIEILAGQTYGVDAAANGAAVIRLSSGDSLTLLGVAPSAVNDGWFVTA
ncbi:PQQ-dependent sugar dehydrogenase [Azospirillum halopraeferens]|uniref:PQQ-dependent sugar dehydrogenase n=1 Tax=Azospirillum halopraeferens TaxID=34010 RepID=UPI0004079809|nr:PQQ-dependent sugar dehydrogenase [Azospirillum halopraeferens]